MSTYNNFKSTTIKGTLQVSDHPTDNTKLSNAIFDRNVTVGQYLKVNGIINADNYFFGITESNLYSDRLGFAIAWNNPGSARGNQG
jgi:hypothetical protein